MELAIEVTIFLAIFGALIKLFTAQARHDARVSILWEAYKEEARASTRKRGTMERSGQWKLTQKGQEMIPLDLREEIKSLVSQKKLNPRKLKTWDVIENLGGVSRLAIEAEKVDVYLQEMIVMVECYIQCHLDI